MTGPLNSPAAYVGRAETQAGGYWGDTMPRKSVGSAGRELASHPVLAKLVAAPDANEAGDIIKLQGYIGPGSDADHLRLYPSLDDFSESVEIARADVLDHADAPKSSFPHGGTSVWLKKGANVVYNRTQQVKTYAEFLGGAISRAHLSAQQNTPMTALVVGAPDTHVQACNPTNTCGYTCATCSTRCEQDTCGTCHTCQTLCNQNTCAAVPPNDLGSNINYFIASNCDPLIQTNVIIYVTQDIVPDPSNKTKGFSFQLNAYSPAGALCQAQQYGFVVDTTDGNAVISGFVDNWSTPTNELINHVVKLLSLDSPKLPAGFSLEISLLNDSEGNVNTVEFVISDSEGQLLVDQNVDLLQLATQADLAPILAFEIDLVGPYNGEAAQLTSGAGNFSYSAQTLMTAQSSQPTCTAAQGWATEELANSAYGSMPCNPSKGLFQDFSVLSSSSGVTNRRRGTFFRRPRRPSR